MAPISFLHLTNPLLSSTQLIRFQDRSTSETQSVHFAQSILTQAAGILLRLPQEIIASSLVLLQRYNISSTGSKYDARTISSAVVYLTAKLSFTPLSPRSVINVYAYLTTPSSSPLWVVSPDPPTQAPQPSDYYVSEGTYEQVKLQLFAAENEILATIGFDTHVALPHGLALTYLQVLGTASRTKLAQRVFEHLNGALCSPQLLYLTHQPNALAVAAIYLAAKEAGIKLVEEPWWEVFDVDREDLGFLVLAFGSLANFATAEREKHRGKTVRLT